MVSLKDAHSDTGVMGDLLKKKKKKGWGGEQQPLIWGHLDHFTAPEI